MWRNLDSHEYVRFHNLIIPSRNGTAQLDHLLVSRYGLFIVETKNKQGWIFGSRDQAKWTQTFYRKKYSFQNPLRQTYRQKKVLAEFLEVNESVIRTVVYFVGDCEFRTHMPDSVINSRPGDYIKQFKRPVLSELEVDGTIEKLRRYRSESTIKTRDHLRSLRERHGSNTICPKCGSDLVERTARKGANAGSKFLGCGNYPRCRFTKNLQMSRVR